MPLELRAWSPVPTAADMMPGAGVLDSLVLDGARAYPALHQSDVALERVRVVDLRDPVTAWPVMLPSPSGSSDHSIASAVTAVEPATSPNTFAAYSVAPGATPEPRAAGFARS